MGICVGEVPKEAMLFEETLSEKLGPDIQRMLTAKEIELSIPVLLDYSKLMNRISGIPTRFLLLELLDRVCSFLFSFLALF